MNPEEIAELKAKLANTPRKAKTPGLKIPADQQLVSKEIILTARGMVGGRKVITPLALEQYWTNNLKIWEQKLEQVQVYFTIFHQEIDPRDRDIIFTGVFNYIIWEESKNLPDTQEVEMKLKEPLQTIVPSPSYNPMKTIPWLVQNWPQILQYLIQGDFYELATPELTNPNPIEEPEEEEDVEEFSTRAWEPLDFPEIPQETKKAPQKTETSKGKGKTSEEDQKKKVVIELTSSTEPEDPGDDGSESGSEDDDPDRGERQLSESRKLWEKTTGYTQTTEKVSSASAKKANKLAKIPNPEVLDGKADKWKDSDTFDQWVDQVQVWLEYQDYDIQDWESLDRAQFLLKDSARTWYTQYIKEKKTKRKGNFHEFMLNLRKKLIPSTSPEIQWKKWNGAHQTSDMSVNQYAQILQEFKIKCKDGNGEDMISQQALKYKLVEGLQPALRASVKPHVDYSKTFEEILVLLEKHQATLGKSIHQPPHKKPGYDKQWSAGKPMEFIQSSYKLPPKVLQNAKKVAHVKGGPGGTYGHFPNARKDQTKYKSIGDREKEQLAKEGKCFYCKKPGHNARNCPSKVSSAYTSTRPFTTNTYPSNRPPATSAYSSTKPFTSSAYSKRVNKSPY